MPEEWILLRCRARDTMVVRIHESLTVIKSADGKWTFVEIPGYELHSSYHYQHVRKLIPEDVVRKDVTVFLETTMTLVATTGA